MARGTIKLPENDYERHNEQRKEMGLTWAEYIDGDEELTEINRTFYIPRKGGYVREVKRDGSSIQVCDKLLHRGNTLKSSPGRPFLDLIRSEYYARRAAERRENNDL